MSAKDMAGHFSGGWGNFYSTPNDVDQGAPHLRTYQGRQAEKFFETFKQPFSGEMRPGKAPAPPQSESLTWGVGGTLPCGRQRLEPFPAAGFKFSQKRYLVPNPAAELAAGEDMGRKAHVYDETGLDLKDRRSSSYYLENVMQRKTRVPEEVRSEAREIHRMAPPGLKGYMGAEYSNDFFLGGHPVSGSFVWDHPPHRGGEQMARPSGGLGSKTRKTFNQKRLEEEVAEQVLLVSRLQMVDDDDDDDGEAAPAPE